MTREGLFIESLRRQYQLDGWEALPAEQAHADLGFAADLILQKGNDHLVIDVKEAGYSESRALKVIRKIIESRKGWRFEVKIIPPTWSPDGGEGVPDDVQRRIDLSQRLAFEGYRDEAFILAWILIEALLRDRVHSDGKKLLALPDLIRQSYENGTIGAEQINTFRRMLGNRNRLVHGLSSDVSGDDVEKLLGLVSSVSSLPQVKRSTGAP